MALIAPPLIAFLTTLLVIEAALPIDDNNAVNDRPVIGVLTQEYRGGIQANSSIIAASYVKYLEAAGARVLPVLINQDASYYDKVFNYTNGILYPGGGDPFYSPSSGYGKAGRTLFTRAIEANNNGDFYPLWATCLGFELLNFVQSGNKLWMKACNAEDLPLPLELVEGHESSRLFRNIPQDVKSFLTTLPVTINYHQWCFTPENYTKSGLDKFFRILSTNRDVNNLTFISTVEAINYPFYGVAWHPEKNSFEFVRTAKTRLTPHSYEAVRVTQHFANFFVNEARKSGHRFPDEKTERSMLIYNFNPTYTAPRKSQFEQEYFFPLN